MERGVTVYRDYYGFIYGYLGIMEENMETAIASLFHKEIHRNPDLPGSIGRRFRASGFGALGFLGFRV